MNQPQTKEGPQIYEAAEGGIASPFECQPRLYVARRLRRFGWPLLLSSEYLPHGKEMVRVTGVCNGGV
jgi:hypothetical protein